MGALLGRFAAVAMVAVGVNACVVTISARAASTTAARAANTTPAQYASAVSRLATAYQGATNRFAQANPSGTLAALASSARTFATANARFADALAALDPPPGLAVAQDRLVAVIRAFAGDLSALSRDAGAGDRTGVEAVARRITALMPRLQAAERAISAPG